MGPTQEALALADFLIAKYGLKLDRYALAYAIMDHEEEAMRATTPQDAAGLKPAAWMATSKPSSDGTVAIQFTHNPDYANECRRADWTVAPLYTTPPPGVDVGKLRDAVKLLDIGIASQNGGRVSIHLTRAKQMRNELAAIIDATSPGVGNG